MFQGYSPAVFFTKFLVNFLGALTSDRFAELRTAELDRQRATYLYRRAIQHETRSGAR